MLSTLFAVASIVVISTMIVWMPAVFNAAPRLSRRARRVFQAHAVTAVVFLAAPFVGALAAQLWMMS